MSTRRAREDFEEEGSGEGSGGSEDDAQRDNYDDMEFSSDDENMGGRKNRKKRRKKKKQTLLDIEAEEDEAEEEDEDDGADMREFTTAHEGEEDAGEEAARAHMKLQRMKMDALLRGDDNAALERYTLERYGRDDDYDDLEAAEEAGAIDQNSLAPTVRDPRLFMVRCRKPGHERKAIISLLQKYFDYKRRNIDLGIFSAVCPEHLKGMIYIEAHNVDTVRAALTGLELFNTYKAPVSIAVEEMTDVMRVGKRAEKQQRGNWVRIARAGIYKGDLAQVYLVREGGNDNQIMIRLIPRLDFKNENDDDEFFDGENEEFKSNIKRTKKGRPPQKLFDKREVLRMSENIDVYTQRDRQTGETFEVYKGELFKHGLLYKKVSVKTLITGDAVMPQADELEKFQLAEQRMKLALGQGEDDLDGDTSKGLGLDISSLSGKRRINFFKGDAVRIVKGEQKGLTGIIEGFNRDMISIRSAELPEPIMTHRYDLVKDFKLGEHVKVATGRRAGMVGVIVDVDNDFLTLFTDSTKEEIRVLSSNVVESSELAAESQSTESSANAYQVFDLVELHTGRRDRGVVTKVQEEMITILDTRNRVRQIPLRDVKGKVPTDKTRAHDLRGNPIAPNDNINVSFGPLKDRRGVVLHIAGMNTIFFKAPDEIKNCGILAVDSRNCTASTAAARRLTSTLTGLGGYANGRTPRPSSMARPGSAYRNRFALPAPIPPGMMSSLASGRGRFANGLPPKSSRGPRDELYRRYVTIKSGPYKGYKGRVVDANERTVRIELDSKNKVISIARHRVAESAQETKNESDALSRRQAVSVDRMAVGQGMRTPGRGYAPGTPAHMMGSQTPSRSYEGAFRDNNPAPMFNPAQGGLQSAYASFRQVPGTPAVHEASADDSIGGMTEATAQTPLPSTPGPTRQPHTPLPQTPLVEPGTPHVPYSGAVNGTRRGERLQVQDAGIQIPQTPAVTPGPTTPAPLTPGPTPVVPSTPVPTTPAVLGGEEVDGVPESEIDGGTMGYEVLVDVVVSVRSMDNMVGVVEEASGNGTSIRVRMENGERVTVSGDDIQAMQPTTDLEGNDFEAHVKKEEDMEERPPRWEKVKILDGRLQGKVGRLVKVKEIDDKMHGVVKIETNGQTNSHVLDMGLVARCFDADAEVEA